MPQTIMTKESVMKSVIEKIKDIPEETKQDKLDKAEALSQIGGILGN